MRLMVKNKRQNPHITNIWINYKAVSYTHLDVYKRQVQLSARADGRAGARVGQNQPELARTSHHYHPTPLTNTGNYHCLPRRCLRAWFIKIIQITLLIFSLYSLFRGGPGPPGPPPYIRPDFKRQVLKPLTERNSCFFSVLEKHV